MTLPVSSYEELLTRVRSLTSETIQLHQEITMSLSCCSDVSISSTKIIINDGDDDGDVDQHVDYDDDKALNPSFLIKLPFNDSQMLHEGYEQRMTNRSARDNKIEVSDNRKEFDSELENIEGKPLQSEVSQKAERVADTFPLWHSGPSDMPSARIQNTSSRQQDSACGTENEHSVGVTTSLNLKGESFNLFSPSSRAYSHQQLGAKVEMVYNLLSMLGTSNREDMSKTFLAMSSSSESCHAMRQSGCIPLLIQLIHSPELEAEVRDRAARALQNIVHAQTDDKRRRRETVVLKLLEQLREYCQILKSSHRTKNNSPKGDAVEHPVVATGALMKFSFDAEHRQAICTLGGLQALMELIQVDHGAHGPIGNGDDCHTIRRYAGMSLTNLTFGDGKNKALLCGCPDFLRSLVDQLRCPSEDLKQVTASVLRNLSWRADSESRNGLRAVGAVTSLTVAAMEAKKESTLKAVLSALWNLSVHCSTNKVDICSVPGALAFLVKMLRYNSVSNTLAIVENTGGIIRNISSHVAVREDYRQILRDNNCFEILLEQLRSTSLTIVSNACGTLWNLSARCLEDQKKLWEMGAASMLRNLVQSKHKMISMGSSAALRNLLAANPDGGLTTHLDMTAKSLGLQNLPTLTARKQRALEREIDICLAETCDDIESIGSPVNHVENTQTTAKGNFGCTRSDSRESVRSSKSDSACERFNQMLAQQENKTFESRNATLHESLKSESRTQREEDQKFMRRYRSSLIPTIAKKKLNSVKKINQNDNDGKELESNPDSHARDKCKRGIPVLKVRSSTRKFSENGESCAAGVGERLRANAKQGCNIGFPPDEAPADTLKYQPGVQNNGDMNKNEKEFGKDTRKENKDVLSTSRPEPDFRSPYRAEAENVAGVDGKKTKSAEKGITNYDCNAIRCRESIFRQLSEENKPPGRMDRMDSYACVEGCTVVDNEVDESLGGEVHVETGPDFKLGFEICDSRFLQLEASKICQAIRKYQDGDPNSQMSVVSCGSFLDTGDCSLFDTSNEVVDFDESEHDGKSKDPEAADKPSIKPGLFASNDYVSLPSLGSVKIEQIDAIDLDSSIMSVASIVSEIADYNSTAQESECTKTVTYKSCEDEARNVEENFYSCEMRNLVAFNDETECVDDYSSSISQENMPWDQESSEETPRAVIKKSITPREKRKMVRDRYRTYTIRDLRETPALETRDEMDSLRGEPEMRSSTSENNRNSSSFEKTTHVEGDRDDARCSNLSDDRNADPVRFPKPDFIMDPSLGKHSSGPYDPAYAHHENVQFSCQNAVVNSKSLNDLKRIGALERNEVAVNAKLVALSLKTAVRGNDSDDVASGTFDSEGEFSLESQEIDTTTYSKDRRKEAKHRFDDYAKLENPNLAGPKIGKPTQKRVDNAREHSPKGVRGRRKALHSSCPGKTVSSSFPLTPVKTAHVGRRKNYNLATTKSLPNVNENGFSLQREGTFTKTNSDFQTKCDGTRNRSADSRKDRKNKSSWGLREEAKFVIGTDKISQVAASSTLAGPLPVPALVDTHEKSATPVRNDAKRTEEGKIDCLTAYPVGLSGSLATSGQMKGFSSNSTLSKSHVISNANGFLHKTKFAQVHVGEFAGPKDRGYGPRKDAESKIARLWKLAEEAKQRGKNMKDSRVWISAASSATTGTGADE